MGLASSITLPHLRRSDAPPGGWRNTWEVVVHFFLSSRPYSYATEVSRALLVALLVVGAGATSVDLWLAVAQTLAMWLYFNWHSDRRQGDAGRIPARAAQRGAAIGLALAIGAAWGGLWGVLGVAAYAATIHAYAVKARSAALGPAGPLFRGLTVWGHFTMIVALFAVVPSAEALWVVLALSLWKATRNLVGDVRDIRTDRHEVPARFGPGVAAAVVNLGLAATVASLAAGRPRGWVFAAAVVAAFGLLNLLLRRRSRGNAAGGAAVWGLASHQVMVPVTALLQAGLAGYYGLSLPWSLGVIGVQVLLFCTYYINPGKHFPRWSAVWGRGTVGS